MELAAVISKRLARDLCKVPVDPADCIYRHVASTSRVMASAFDQALQPAQLTANQFNLLMTLQRQGPLTMGRLAELLATDPSTLSRLLRTLLATRLAVTAIGTDRRERIVQLTTSGSERLRRALPLWLATQQALSSALGAQRWQTTQRNLTILRRTARRSLRA